ncbi:MAG: hypothetical protein JMN26_03900, partial [gamma proteobacterium endosymbiont of Lamellibrachia anaximandri]|nr:hypothetical protein [gamma proteobacterium endosymbiont of Lamellibrachia anaximandri]
LPLWRKARRVSSAASRLPGTTSLRFALHGWQRMPAYPRPPKSTHSREQAPNLNTRKRQTINNLLRVHK